MNNIKVFKRWLDFLGEVKTQMHSLGYKEVLTPSLVRSPAMEAYLESFKVIETKRAEKSEPKEPFYLPTSPEFGLKKIWLSGDPDFRKIFEIAKAFRAEESHEHSPFHLPEFTMLEFYNDSLNLKEFICEVSRLCKILLNKVTSEKEEERPVSLPSLFFKITGEKLHPHFKKTEFRALLKKLKVKSSKTDSLSDLFQRLYLEFIEPELNKRPFVVISDFPPFLSALSKVSKIGWAERFEIYIEGLEVANGYNELLNPKSVEQRWLKENQLRIKMGAPPHPIDQKLLESLEKTSLKKGVGVALGLERIFYAKEKLGGRSISLKETVV